jgi:hypothetical protein
MVSSGDASIAGEIVKTLTDISKEPPPNLPPGTLLYGGNVGVGTTAPADKLTVQTATENYGIIHTDGTVSVGTYVSATNGGYVGTKSNHKLNFMTNNGVARLTIDTAGFVGINTQTPTAPLDIQGYIRMGNYAGGNYDNIQFLRGTTGSEFPNIRCQENYFGLYTTTAGGWVSDSQPGDMVMRPNISFRVGRGGQSYLVCHQNTNVGINIATPAYKLAVAGNMRVQSGNDSMTVYGANATWGAYLIVGSGTDRSGGATAQVISTNGNLHLDAGNNNDMYYGYYANARGTPNPHRWFGGNYVWDSVPQNTSPYSQPVMFDGNTFRRSQCVAKAVYNSNSVAWGGGVNMTYAFYNYNTAVQVVLTGRYSGYWTSSVQCEFIVRIYNQSSGAYYYYQLNTFTNNTYNHVSMPLNLHIGNTGVGWNDVYVYVNFGLATDGNDHLQVNALTFPVGGY